VERLQRQRPRAKRASSDISVGGLEQSLRDERAKQGTYVTQLTGFSKSNDELQDALASELTKLRELSRQLERERGSGGVGAKMRSLLARLPWFKGRILTRHSIEELLRAQYEVSAGRVKDAAELADRLRAAKSELRAEIDRLNQKVIDSARDERTCANAIVDLELEIERLSTETAAADPGSVAARELQAKLDTAQGDLVEQSTRLTLHATAEERLDRLKDGTLKLAETITTLSDDMTLYVTAAGEKMDLIAGQIQAIGAAADAALVLLELQHSIDAMTASVNDTTRFVAETQLYFRQNVDRLVDEMQIYDRQTVEAMAKSKALSTLEDELAVEQARDLAHALVRPSKRGATT